MRSSPAWSQSANCDWLMIAHLGTVLAADTSDKCGQYMDRRLTASPPDVCSLNLDNCYVAEAVPNEHMEIRANHSNNGKVA